MYRDGYCDIDEGPPMLAWEYYVTRIMWGWRRTVIVDVHQLSYYGARISVASTGLSTYINCCMNLHSNARASMGLSTYFYVSLLGFVFLNF